MSQNDLSYEKSLVVSIDILGTKSMINSGNAVNLIQILHQEYEKTINWVKKNDKDYSAIKPYKFQVFSDNIAIVKELIKKDPGLELYSFAEIIALFQARLWCNHGLLSRGGIAIGKCFADGLMVLGEGLVKAYTLESQIAVYPRTVLSPDLQEYANSLKTASRNFAEDFDGYFYVDYISLWNRKFTNEQKEAHVSKLQSALNNTNDVKIKQKYNWLIQKIKENNERNI